MTQDAAATAAPVEQRVELLDGGTVLANDLPDQIGVVLAASQEEGGIRVERANLRSHACGR
jgi:hypothetical protein